MTNLALQTRQFTLKRTFKKKKMDERRSKFRNGSIF